MPKRSGSIIVLVIYKVLRKYKNTTLSGRFNENLQKLAIQKQVTRKIQEQPVKYQ